MPIYTYHFKTYPWILQNMYLHTHKTGKYTRNFHISNPSCISPSKKKEYFLKS